MTLRGTLLIIWMALLCIAAFWQPYNPDAIDLGQRFARPSLEHALGTDQLGRDVLSRMMVGGLRTTIVVMTVALVGAIGGCFFGTAAASLGGFAEAAILRVAETSIVIPTLIVALTAAAVFGLRPTTAGIALGLAGVGPYALLAHALARRTAAQPYVLAAHALGVAWPQLMLRHILPNILPTVLTHVGSNAGLAVTAYASLAFLGLGADPSKPDWGAMLFEYRLFIFDHPMLLAWPGLGIAITAGLLNIVFDRD